MLLAGATSGLGQESCKVQWHFFEVTDAVSRAWLYGTSTLVFAKGVASSNFQLRVFYVSVFAYSQYSASV